VLGLEGDWSHVATRTSIAFAGTIPPFGGVSGTLGADLHWIATARARAGFSAGPALVYGTAGLAVARASGELAILGVGAPITFSDEALLGGWVIGAGVEYALSPVWTLKGEVLRMHFGTGLFSSSGGAVPLTSSVDVYNLRAGINYKF
jgi:outer membrane immunogenic protein